MTNPDKRRIAPYNRRYEKTVYSNPNAMEDEYEHDMVNQTPDVANGHRGVAPPTTYQAGYRDGRLRENRVQDLRDRDNDNAARGMLIGIILMSFVGLVVGILFFLAGQNRSEIIENPTVVPLPNVPTEPEAPAASDTDSVTRERIIERTEVVPVPVPQPQAPAEGQAQQAPVQQAPVQQAPVQQAPVQQTPVQVEPQQPQGSHVQPQQPGQGVAPGTAPAAGAVQ